MEKSYPSPRSMLWLWDDLYRSGSHRPQHRSWSDEILHLPVIPDLQSRSPRIDHHGCEEQTIQQNIPHPWLRHRSEHRPYCHSECHSCRSCRLYRLQYTRYHRWRSNSSVIHHHQSSLRTEDRMKRRSRIALRHPPLLLHPVSQGMIYHLLSPRYPLITSSADQDSSGDEWWYGVYDVFCALGYANFSLIKQCLFYNLYYYIENIPSF